MPTSLETLSYASVQAKLGSKSEKRFSANSKLVKVEVTTDGLFGNTHEHQAIGLKLHGTIVALWFANGFVGINSGGYHTNTTKRYIGATGVSVFQKNFEWFVWQGRDADGNRSVSIPFKDGMIFDTDGKVLECDTVSRIVEVR